MNFVTFTIDRTEVEKIAGKKLSLGVVEKVLTLIENDTVLWDDIEESIVSAVESTTRR